MIRIYSHRAKKCEINEVSPSELQIDDETIWVDLLDPNREEELAVEAQLGFNVPTFEEMVEIEASSRLYRQGEQTYMTATVVTHAFSEERTSAAITFVLSPKVLVTVRYETPKAFKTVLQQVKNSPDICASPSTIFVSIIATIVDRLADVLEQLSLDLNTLSSGIFSKTKGQSIDFETKLSELGKKGDIISRVRESLFTLSRLTMFALQSEQIKNHASAAEEMRVAIEDIASLNTHLNFISNKATFLLDATLGMINIEQNATIKMFSVVAFVFLPPTLIASNYGMNFEFMPELDWEYGYLVAIVAMIISMIIPYVIFKRKGWF